MNVELLTNIAEWLEAGAPEAYHGFGFDMRWWKMTGDAMDPFGDESRETCGTTCCIAGAAIELSGVMSGFSEWTNGADCEYVARSVLGLTEEQAQSLFDPWLDDYRNRPNPMAMLLFDEAGIRQPINPRAAAKVVRHLIATGEVDWFKAMPEDVAHAD